MITMRFDGPEERRIEDLVNLYKDGTAFLIGGSPSLSAAEFEILDREKPLMMSINNAGVDKITPTFWCGGDHPDCYAIQILSNPAIFKYASAIYCLNKKWDIPYNSFPNIRFFIPKQGISWNDAFRFRKEVPWYNNTLYSAILILYKLGIRNILLYGCDFNTDDESYSHRTVLTDKQQKWNKKLYSQQKFELTSLKPIFKQQGLELFIVTDNSQQTRLGYTQITLTEALNMCSNWTLESTLNLPHSSEFDNEN